MILLERHSSQLCAEMQATTEEGAASKASKKKDKKLKVSKAAVASDNQPSAVQDSIPLKAGKATQNGKIGSVSDNGRKSKKGRKWQ